jgi:RNA polymerase primary sigma factor
MAQHDASLKSYLREISRYPLLTPEQEICYGRQIVSMQAVLERGGDLSREDRRVVRVGNMAKRKFMCSNLKLVVSIAKKYNTEQRKSLDLMDLVQEGNIGLARAVELFDPSRGYRFTTYAYWWIRQSIHRAIAQMDAMVRIPVSLHDKLVRATRVGHVLYQRYGRVATSEELAEELGVPVDTLLIGIRRHQRHTSLDMAPHGNDEGAIVDSVPYTNEPDVYAGIDRGRLSDRALTIFDTTLDSMTKYVLVNRLTDVPMPWKELHRRCDIPISKLRQLEQTGLRKLRVALELEGLVG